MALYVRPGNAANNALSSGELLCAVLNEVYTQNNKTLPIKLISKKNRADLDAVALAKNLLETVIPEGRDDIATETCATISTILFRRRPVVTLDPAGLYVPQTTWGNTWRMLKSQTKKTGRSAVLNIAIRSFVEFWFMNVVRPLRFSSGIRGTGGNTTANDRNATFAERVLVRDGYKCAATGGVKFSSGVQGLFRTTIEVAHIIPHHLKKNDAVTREVAEAFQLFGGIDATTNIQDDIDTLCNGIPMDICLHRSFDRLEWSIQVVQGVYYLRYVRAPTANPAIGVATQVVQGDMVLTFGGNNDEKPKPELCNLHHAICRFVHLAGMADVFDEIEDDDDEYVDGVPYLELVVEPEMEIEGEAEDDDEDEFEINDDDIPNVEEYASRGGNGVHVSFIEEEYVRETVLVN